MTFAIFGNVEKPGLKEALMVLLARLEHSGMEYALDEALAPMVAVLPSRIGRSIMA